MNNLNLNNLNDLFTSAEVASGNNANHRDPTFTKAFRGLLSTGAIVKTEHRVKSNKRGRPAVLYSLNTNQTTNESSNAD